RFTEALQWLFRLQRLFKPLARTHVNLRDSWRSQPPCSASSGESVLVLAKRHRESWLEKCMADLVGWVQSVRQTRPHIQRIDVPHRILTRPPELWRPAMSR